SHRRQEYSRLQTGGRGGYPVQQVLWVCADPLYEAETAPLRDAAVARASDEPTAHVSFGRRRYRPGPPVVPQPAGRASPGLVSSRDAPDRHAADGERITADDPGRGGDVHAAGPCCLPTGAPQMGAVARQRLQSVPQDRCPRDGPGRGGCPTGDATAPTLLKAPQDFDSFAERDGHCVPDYGERYSEDERVRTGLVESTGNQIISRRLCMKQHMQWTKRGAQLFLTMRVKTLKQELGA